MTKPEHTSRREDARSEAPMPLKGKNRFESVRILCSAIDGRIYSAIHDIKRFKELVDLSDLQSWKKIIFDIHEENKKNKEDIRSAVEYVFLVLENTDQLPLFLQQLPPIEMFKQLLEYSFEDVFPKEKNGSESTDSQDVMK